MTTVALGLPEPPGLEWHADAHDWHLPEVPGHRPAPVQALARQLARVTTPPENTAAMVDAARACLLDADDLYQQARAERAAAEALADAAARQREGAEGMAKEIATLRAVADHELMTANQQAARAQAMLEEARTERAAAEAIAADAARQRAAAETMAKEITTLRAVADQELAMAHQQTARAQVMLDEVRAARAARARPRPKRARAAVGDAAGQNLRPDPAAAQTPAELAALLRRFRAWAGNPSYRDMAQRADHRAAASTMCKVLHRGELPARLDVVDAIIEGCGGSEEDRQRFATAWRRLTMPADAEQAPPPPRLRALPQPGPAATCAAGTA